MQIIQIFTVKKNAKSPWRQSVSLSSFHLWGLTDKKWFNPAKTEEKILIKKTGKPRKRARKKKKEKKNIFDGSFKGHYWNLWKVTKGSCGELSQGVKGRLWNCFFFSYFLTSFHFFPSSTSLLLFFLYFLLSLFPLHRFLLPLPFLPSSAPPLLPLMEY